MLRTTSTLSSRDLEFVVHPYASLTSPNECLAVSEAEGAEITLENGKIVVDGMSSWWSAVHGYRHPVIIEAIRNQLENHFAHVMFGGLTHKPAIDLCEKLSNKYPIPNSKVFLSDSGSVAVEVALKMVMQYWNGRNQPKKRKMIAHKRGYHGDTISTMNVSDTGMHDVFKEILSPDRTVYVDEPKCGFNERNRCSSPEDCSCVASMKNTLEDDSQIGGIIVEPIVQGAGGMRFYSPTYLTRVRQLADEHDVLFMVDEIATGFGRTGEFFAVSHGDGVVPDIACLGKAITGGSLTLAATLMSRDVAEHVSANGTPFMHGPTFMANALACAAANASFDLLTADDAWRPRVKACETWLNDGLAGIEADGTVVRDVRVLGAIGVVELVDPLTSTEFLEAQESFINDGVWIRPFGELLYVMPTFMVAEEHHVRKLCIALENYVSVLVERRTSG